MERWLGKPGTVLYATYRYRANPNIYEHGTTCTSVPREDTGWLGPQCFVGDPREGGGSRPRPGRVVYRTRRSLCFVLMRFATSLHSDDVISVTPGGRGLPEHIHHADKQRTVRGFAHRFVDMHSD